MDNTKALVLFSGGLDSTLAVKLLVEQGIEVVGITFTTPFTNPSIEGAKELNIPLKIIHLGEEYLEIVKLPKYGYGKNMNPCIDCKIFMLKRAKEYMAQVGAEFIATGEVLGERPKSQKKDALWIIERDSDLKGLLLRPLSAKLLPATIAEEKGWVNREKLLNIQGRSRKPQMALAKEFGITTYETPAGGCLLTDPIFSRKLKDLFTCLKDDTSLNDIQLLTIGRHFRLSPTTKIIVGRNDEENKKLLEFQVLNLQVLNLLAQVDDILFKVVNFPGPITILRGKGGKVTQEHLELTARLTARYSKAKEEDMVAVEYWGATTPGKKILSVSPIKDSELVSIRI
ncbi:MAG: tRNA 4-thiouridine(8) synthase ThiI [bacterium]|nr:tRNA 4-thiouridine(8) synthase ThiI [bacterium]